MWCAELHSLSPLGVTRDRTRAGAAAVRGCFISLLLRVLSPVLNIGTGCCYALCRDENGLPQTVVLMHAAPGPRLEETIHNWTEKGIRTADIPDRTPLEELFQTLRPDRSSARRSARRRRPETFRCSILR